MIALNRLEKEIIFLHFEKNMPKLYVKADSSFFCIKAEEYKKEENRIILFKSPLLSFTSNKEIVVFFFHKKVKIVFQTILKKEQKQYFDIPESIYVKKRKKNAKTPFPFLSIYSQNLLLSTFLSANLKHSTHTKEIQEKEKLKEVFTLSEKMGHNLLYLINEIKRFTPKEENLYSQFMIINNFLVKKEKGKLKEKSLYIFSNSSIILLFANIKFAQQFESNKNKLFQAKISFKDRNILCNVCYCFFSPFFKNGKEVKEGFLGLKITNIQEEDKRYLYEGVFLNYYGKMR